MPVLMYGSEKMVWMEEERSRIRVVHIDKLRSLLGIRRMYRDTYEVKQLRKGRSNKWWDEEIMELI